MRSHRLGLAGRIIVGLLAMTAFSLAAAALAVLSVNKLSAGLAVSNEGFRSALKASAVAQQSGALATILASAAPRLRDAPTEAAREAEEGKITPALQALRQLLEDVALLPVDPRAAEDVRKHGATLISRIEALDGLVRAKIALDADYNDRAPGVLRAQEEVETLSEALTATTDADVIDQWMNAGFDLTGSLINALAMQEAPEIKTYEDQARRYAVVMSESAPKLVGEKVEAAVALTQKLARLADPSESAALMRERQLNAVKALDSNQQVRVEAGQAFEGAVNRLINRISANVDRSSADLAEMADNQHSYLMLLAAAGLIGALGIAAYVNFGVVRRLVRLRDTMTDRVEGKPHPIDTSGDDELSDMALALEHFVLKIEANERNLRVAREAADAANQAKSAFLAAMSHEIRTPMNGVTTMAELLIRTRLNDEQKSIAQVIIDSGVSLLAIINDILDFSKIEAGKIDLEWVETDIDGLIKGVGRLLEARARERGLTLQVTIDPRLPAAMRVDPTRLRQILLNLLGNAIKFTESGSVSLTVEARGTPVEGETQPLRFAITDTGIGLTSEQKDRLFKPFSQADGSITRRFGGTGLGLSICKRLTEMMNGEIAVDSAPGVGSTFHFTLPLTVISLERRASESKAAVGAPTAWKEWTAPDREIAIEQGARLLAADDNPTNRLVLAALFDRLGYVVDLVRDGEEAWAALQSQRYGLLLTDCHMPNLDGFALTRRLREAEAGGGRAERLPVVALTADAVAGTAEECLRAGMDDYVAKPINVGQLDETILRLLPIVGSLRTPAEEIAVAAPDHSPALESEADDDIDAALDMAVVAENFGEIGPDAREMLEMFLSSTELLIEEMERALRVGDDDAARDAAHSARGASNMAGARRLGALLTEIETTLKAGDAEKAKLTAPAVRPSFVAVRQAVARLCDKVGVG